MKNKTIGIGIAALSLAAVSGYSQGTITFQNTSSTLVTTNDGNGNIGTAPVTSSSGIKVQLFYQLNNGQNTPAPIGTPGTSTFVSQGAWEAISTLASISPLAGRFNQSETTGADVYGANNASGNVFLEAVAFNGNAASLTAAMAGGSTYIGYSTVWSQGTGNNSATPPTSAVSTSTGFTGLQLNLVPVPEPTTIALAGMGAASLLLFRRRK